VQWKTFDFFSEAECDAIVEELTAASADAATVYGVSNEGTVDARVRRTKQVMPSEGTRVQIHQRLEAFREPLAHFFGIALTSCEAPQFLRYESGDYFVMHQDGNTPLIRDDSRHRRVSATRSGTTSEETSFFRRITSEGLHARRRRRNAERSSRSAPSSRTKSLP
jgi:predicted 2-oxoglutarate/Fe(II)-dependent dioxygenase YbiX